MKLSFYPRLAWDGIHKNRRMYIPYMITCVCMIMMHYILAFLASPLCLRLLPRGSGSAQTILTMGECVMLLFALIFLYYTNSFLIRRRKKEFGLYNALGMGKLNLIRIIVWESLITAAISLVCGLVVGILLSKIAELGLVNMIGGEISFRFVIEPQALLRTALYFTAIFLLILFSAVIRVVSNSAISMMKSVNVGEKPPKANWFWGLSGIVMLGFAYYLAISISNPIDAVIWFFVAVLMVIVATYLIMISGSVLLCRILQKKKSYYYNPRHYVSVSSMVYRMKRNGAGLASICIIATMVLVMLSSSSCLYIGAEDALSNRYPRQINLEVRFDDSDFSPGNVSAMQDAAEQYCSDNSVAVTNVRSVRYANVSGHLEGTRLQCDYEFSSDSFSYNGIYDLYIISAEDYFAGTDAAVSLDNDEGILLTDGCRYSGDTISLLNGSEEHVYRLAEIRSGSVVETGEVLFSTLTLVVNDIGSAIDGFTHPDNPDSSIATLVWKYGFDTDLSTEEQIDFAWDLEQFIADSATSRDYSFNWLNAQSRAVGSMDYYSSNASLFFIGIMLSFVFLLAAVLIIYYKQLSEGYEDHARFSIMQKVGMTGQEIRRSINSQLLTVFFLPMLFSGMHLACAFPMIQKLLTLFSLFNVRLFIATSLVSYIVFALFYTVIYRITSKAYYNIVSDMNSME